jgi:hypothetical protein
VVSREWIRFGSKGEEDQVGRLKSEVKEVNEVKELKERTREE